MSKERRKVRTGRVVSDKMDKTVVVAVRWSQRHRLYGKPIRRITKFYAHDATNDCSTGDLVQIEETRPISRLKNWRVIDVLERRDVAEVRPMELDREFMESQMRGQDAQAEVIEEDAVVEEQVAVAGETVDEVDVDAEALALEEAVAEMDAPEEPQAVDGDEIVAEAVAPAAEEAPVEDVTEVDTPSSEVDAPAAEETPADDVAQADEPEVEATEEAVDSTDVAEDTPGEPEEEVVSEADTPATEEPLADEITEAETPEPEAEEPKAEAETPDAAPDTPEEERKQ